MLTRRSALIGLAASALCNAAAVDAEVWEMNSLDRIGGHKVLPEGHPRLRGQAISFNGKDDAIFLDVHPLAGAQQFTWEVLFRPAADGAPAQRFFHLQEDGTDNRMLFETRLAEGKWYLDSFVKSGDASATLVVPQKTHSLDQWHHAAAVCDGRELRSYVDGALQMAAPLHFIPHRTGRTSIGVRINRVDYFKGDIARARMSRVALEPSQFMTLKTVALGWNRNIAHP